MSEDLQGIAQCLHRVQRRIGKAEARFGRTSGSVQLLAVSKTQPAARIAAARAAGQYAFGESYVREALEKQAALRDLPLHWHFVGHVQSNKARDIAANFHWLHSLDALKHAQRLGSLRPKDLPPLKVCVQINLSGEVSKGGIEPVQAPGLIEACATIPGIEIVGLMTLPAPSDDFDRQRRSFARLRELRDRVAQPSLPLATLSMGMSADLEAAVAEGATIVRVGTAIFGPRPSR